AAALHAKAEVEAGTPIEILTRRRTSVPGLLSRNVRFDSTEVSELPSGLLLATPARVAFDIARHHGRQVAVPHLDALTAATDVSMIQIADLLHRYRGAPGVDRARDALQVMDGGARSARESLLRLALIDAGLPRPATAIAVRDNFTTVVVPVGWERYRVGLTLADTDRAHAWQEQARNNTLQLQGWINLYVPNQRSFHNTVDAARYAIRIQRRRGL
ncbi:MAG: hypothetical protein K0R68_1108, partial [Mycobacterium sp.]|nr:hypothetical protein [Mycobacterium sp.]